MMSQIARDDRIAYDVIDAILDLTRLEMAFGRSLEAFEKVDLEEFEFSQELEGDEERAEYFNELVSSQEREASRFSEIYGQSTFLTGYSLLEFGSLRIAENYLIMTGSDLKIDKFKGTGICKVKNMIAEMWSNEHSIDPKMWDEIDFYRKLRNSLAHQTGLLDEDGGRDRDIELISLISNRHGVFLRPFGRLRQVVVRDFFVRHALSQCRKFLEELNKQLDKRLEQC